MDFVQVLDVICDAYTVFIITAVFIALIVMLIKDIITGKLFEKEEKSLEENAFAQEAENFLIRQQDFLRRYEDCLKTCRHYAGIATDIVDPEEDKPSAEETNVTD